MTKINIRKIEDGKKNGTMEVSDGVFSVDSNPALLHQVVVAYAANRRIGTSHTKNRSERSGSGRKPWKQKGTGNARTGSIRNPIWRGGGIVFGPRKDKNYSKKTTVKMRRTAMCIALSEKLRHDQMIVVDTLMITEVKTKIVATILNILEIFPQSCVIVLSDKERKMSVAARNIPNVKSRSLSTLNAYDLVNHAIVLISKDALKELEERLVVEKKL